MGRTNLIYIESGDKEVETKCIIHEINIRFFPNSRKHTHYINLRHSDVTTLYYDVTFQLNLKNTFYMKEHKKYINKNYIIFILKKSYYGQIIHH